MRREARNVAKPFCAKLTVSVCWLTVKPWDGRVTDVGLMRGWMRIGRAGGRGQVIEHELDMRRMAPEQALTPSRLGRLLRGLKPGGGGTLVGSPMRSVDRELEDRWPSGNRQT